VFVEHTGKIATGASRYAVTQSNDGGRPHVASWFTDLAVTECNAVQEQITDRHVLNHALALISHLGHRWPPIFTWRGPVVQDS
jgi:hypothetical protein